jgi:hypothetical protein
MNWTDRARAELRENPPGISNGSFGTTQPSGLSGAVRGENKEERKVSSSSSSSLKTSSKQTDHSVSKEPLEGATTPACVSEHSKLPAEALPKEPLEAQRLAVRIEYEEGGTSYGFWVVPDRFTDAQLDGEPALRRCEVASLLDKAEGALRRALVVLHAFPGARIRKSSYARPGR